MIKRFSHRGKEHRLGAFQNSMLGRLFGPNRV